MSRSTNYNSGVTTKGQEGSRNTRGLGEGRRNLSGESLPKVGVQNSLKKVCSQPKGRQEFACLLAELVLIATYAGKTSLENSEAEAGTPLLGAVRLRAGEQVHGGSLGVESFLIISQGAPGQGCPYQCGTAAVRRCRGFKEFGGMSKGKDMTTRWQQHTQALFERCFGRSACRRSPLQHETIQRG